MTTHYRVDGRRLALQRSGSGGPPVVFLPGAGLVGLDYLQVHQAAAEHTTAVRYDRAGTGWSDPVPLPRTPKDVVDELRVAQRAGERRLASLVQLLETKEGEQLVRFAYTTDGWPR